MNVTDDDVINEIIMSTGFAVHVLVEGATDKRLFRACLGSSTAVNVLPLDGWDRVVRIIDMVNADPRVAPTLGVIDRDFHLPLGTQLPYKNVETTDFRDLECMIFASPAFASVVDELASDAKVAVFGGVQRVRQALVKVAEEIGRMRFHFQKSGSPVVFKGLDISKFVDRKSLKFDSNKFLNALGHIQSPRQTFSSAELVAAGGSVTSAKTAAQPYFTSPLLLCCGHDLVSTFSLSLRSAIGTLSAQQSSCEIVASALRLAYAMHFKSSALAVRIANWIAANSQCAVADVWI